jgi:hypothetical protein
MTCRSLGPGSRSRSETLVDHLADEPDAIGGADLGRERHRQHVERVVRVVEQVEVAVVRRAERQRHVPADHHAAVTERDRPRRQQVGVGARRRRGQPTTAHQPDGAAIDARLAWVARQAWRQGSGRLLGGFDHAAGLAGAGVARGLRREVVGLLVDDDRLADDAVRPLSESVVSTKSTRARP